MMGETGVAQRSTRTRPPPLSCPPRKTSPARAAAQLEPGTADELDASSSSFSSDARARGHPGPGRGRVSHTHPPHSPLTLHFLRARARRTGGPTGGLWGGAHAPTHTPPALLSLGVQGLRRAISSVAPSPPLSCERKFPGGYSLSPFSASRGPGPRPVGQATQPSTLLSLASVCAKRWALTVCRAAPFPLSLHHPHFHPSSFPSHLSLSLF